MLKALQVKTKDIEAGGGVVFKKSATQEVLVLLIYRNGVWDIPKGKREKKETKKMCARREVMEEVSTDSLPLILDRLVDTYHSYEQNGKLYNKTTFWYSMQLENPDQKLYPETSEGIEKVEWVELEAAISKVGYENLKAVLKDFQSKV
jgi:8-oxo-dGTP pyrophosphatase MutT (NUDIX family)